MTADSYGDLVDAVPSYALKTAATLRLADHIADGHRTVTDLARASNTAPNALDRLMRYLCVRGIFAWTAESGYFLTPFSRLLLDDHPSQLRRSLDLDGHSGRTDQAIALLPHVIRTGMPSYPELFGSSLYCDYAAEPGMEAEFAGIRERQAHFHGIHIARAINIPSGAHVVDVGGGTGALSVSLLQNRHDLTATVFDLPGLRTLARSTLNASKETRNRTAYTSGDFFERVPTGDVHILSNTLFNWNDDQATSILRNVRRASTTGYILVVEQMPDTRNPTEEELALDLRNLALNGGQQRNRDEFNRISHAAGLSITAVTSLNYRSLVAIQLTGTVKPIATI